MRAPSDTEDCSPDSRKRRKSMGAEVDGRAPALLGRASNKMPSSPEAGACSANATTSGRSTSSPPKTSYSPGSGSSPERDSTGSVESSANGGAAPNQPNPKVARPAPHAVGAPPV